MGRKPLLSCGYHPLGWRLDVIGGQRPFVHADLRLDPLESLYFTLIKGAFNKVRVAICAGDIYE